MNGVAWVFHNIEMPIVETVVQMETDGVAFDSPVAHVDMKLNFNLSDWLFKAVFDAVYNPLHTRLLQAARANGARTADGMGMLVCQAVAAHTIWDGSTYMADDIRQLIEDSVQEQQKRFS